VLGGVLGEGDVCVLMGAGDIDVLGRTLAGSATAGSVSGEPGTAAGESR
jgi:hypothetical protein